MKEVSVVIPNYNGIRFLKPCLDSLLKQSFSDFEVIVVDNASTDGSVAYLENHYTQIRLIRLEQNYGFSKAVNEGIKASAGNYVILLNNDTLVEEDFVLALYQAMKDSKNTFSCSSKMVQMSDPSVIDDAGDFYSALGWAFAKGKGKPSSNYKNSYPVFASCAGAAIYRKDLVEKLGFFDEKQFAYLEDIDIGYRAKIHGYKNYFIPAAVCHHFGSGASGSRYNEFKIRLSSQNSIYIIYKNMPMLQILLNLPFLLPGFFVKYLFFLKKGYGKVYWKGLQSGFTLCRQGKKEKFLWKNTGNYMRIQLELWYNTIRRFVE